MFLATIERRLSTSRSREPVPTASTHLTWFGDALLLFFLVPWVGTGILHIDRDLYYACYFAVAILFLAAYLWLGQVDLVPFVAARWRSSLFIGLLSAVFVAINIWRLAETARPDGAYMLFQLFWRGLAYGTVDALVLTVFPCVVAAGVVDAWRTRLPPRLVLAAVSIVLIWSLTAAYHLGYEQFRDSEGVAVPELASTVVSLPMVITMNPAGSVLAHVSLHVTATIHIYESDTFVPPYEGAPREYAPPGVFSSVVDPTSQPPAEFGSAVPGSAPMELVDDGADQAGRTEPDSVGS